jgi:hypothetical protein
MRERRSGEEEAEEEEEEEEEAAGGLSHATMVNLRPVSALSMALGSVPSGLVTNPEEVAGDPGARLRRRRRGNETSVALACCLVDSTE